MTLEPNRISTWLARGRRVAYWLIPPAVFAVIITRIDLAVLRQNLSMIDVWKAIPAPACYLLVIFIGAHRWKVITRILLGMDISFGFMLRQYWIGMIVGRMAPGSLGWDLYRIVAAGRRFGKYLFHAAVVILEKMIGLAVVCLLILLVYPVTASYLEASPVVLDRVRIAAVVMLAAVAVGLAMVLVFRDNRIVAGMFDGAERLITRMLAIMYRRLKGQEVGLIAFPEIRDLLGAIVTPGFLFRFLPLSISIQFASALGHHVLLQAMGHGLPFPANLFVVLIFTFVNSVPISFGGLGVREGAYILLYSLFGLSLESALLVSFLWLLCQLSSFALGGILMLTGDREG